MAWNCRPGLRLYFFIWRMKRVSLFLAISIRSHRERSLSFLNTNKSVMTIEFVFTLVLCPGKRQ